MDREILFRGKRLEDRQWAYGYPLIDNAACSLKAKGKCFCPHDGSDAEIYFWDDEFHEYNSADVDASSIGQYIGKTDANGQRIFEGDIFLHCSDGDILAAGVVRYGEYCNPLNGGSESHVGFYVDWKRLGRKLGWLPLRRDLGYWIERGLCVVGNVCDNPELLKPGTEERTP